MSQQRRRIMVDVLFELIKNPRRSDADIAKILGVWRSTVIRHRKRLERDGIIREYTLIPDFPKLGYEILAFWFLKIKSSSSSRNNEILPESLQLWSIKCPEVIFASNGLFGEWNALIISLHRDFDDLHKFSRKLSINIGEDVEDSWKVLMNLKGTIMKPFSLKYLQEKFTRS